MKLLLDIEGTKYAFMASFEPENIERWHIDVKTGALMFRHHRMGIHEGMMVYSATLKLPAMASTGYFLRPLYTLLYGSSKRASDTAPGDIEAFITGAVERVHAAYRSGKWKKGPIEVLAPPRDTWLLSVRNRYKAQVTWFGTGVFIDEAGPFVKLQDSPGELVEKARQRLKETLLWVMGQGAACESREERLVLAGIEHFIAAKMRFLTQFEREARK